MTKSMQPTAAESTPESRLADSMANLANLEVLLETMIQRRKSLGEYNADSGDLLHLTMSLRVVVQLLQCMCQPMVFVERP